jgi:hypothetical protein
MNMSEDNNESLSWAELLEFLTELKEISPELMEQTVCISNGGSETYAKGIKRDRQNYPYLEGF